MNKVIHGDCLEVMRSLEDKSIGMFLCDLPYGVTACHWDKQLDLDALWPEIKRLIQPKRACVFTATQPFTTDLINSNRKWFKYCWVWEKTCPTGVMNASWRPLKSHEDIVVFSEARAAFNQFNDDGMLYRPQGCTRTSKERMGKTQSGAINNIRATQKRYKITRENFPRTVIKFSWDSSKLHPTQKPVALFEYLIRTYTNEGDTVLDPTAGSMTTAIACMNTGRDYICIEKDPDEYKKGLRRVQDYIEAPRQQSLFKPIREVKPLEITQTVLF